MLSIHSAPACGGKVVAPATKGGLHFLARQGGCMVFAAKGSIKKWRRRRRTSPAQRYYITPEGGALNPSGRRQPVPDRTLGAQGQRPGGAINPRGEAASTFGNTGKHLPADWYLSRDDSLSACTEILRFAQDDCCPAGLPDPRSRSPIPAAPRLRASPQPSRHRRFKL